MPLTERIDGVLLAVWPTRPFAVIYRESWEREWRTGVQRHSLWPCIEAARLQPSDCIVRIVRKHRDGTLQVVLSWN